MKTLLASVIVVLLGVWAISSMSGGFELLTSEQARRLDIQRRQPVVPNVRLTDQSGGAHLFSGWVKEQNKFLIVDFIYTNCQLLCRALGSEFQQLQRNIVERGLQSRVHLLSISFDPEHDSYAVLGQYANHLQANPDVWSFATPVRADLDILLKTFGVTVIPDQMGGFQHNAALVWVAPSGKLLRVTDYASGEQLLDELVKSN